MPTVYERLQHYEKLPNAIKMGRKKIKLLSHRLARIYDEKANDPVEYVDSVEPRGTFTVRNYPESFKKTIDVFIWRHHKAQQEIAKKATNKSNK